MTCRALYLAIFGISIFKLRKNSSLEIVRQSVGSTLNYVFNRNEWDIACETRTAHNKELKKANYFWNKETIKQSKIEAKQKHKEGLKKNLR